jgi:hypothetical protein
MALSYSPRPRYTVAFITRRHIVVLDDGAQPFQHSLRILPSGGHAVSMAERRPQCSHVGDLRVTLEFCDRFGIFSLGFQHPTGVVVRQRKIGIQLECPLFLRLIELDKSDGANHVRGHIETGHAAAAITIEVQQELSFTKISDEAVCESRF